MRTAPAIFAFLFLAILAYFSYGNLNSAMYLAKPWVSPLVTPEEVAAVEWVKANTPERALFVTDIFGGELLMGRALREGVEGGDWAIVPNVVERMADVDKFYDSNSSEEAWNIAKKYGAEYAWAPNRQLFAGFAWKSANEAKFYDARYFDLVFENQTKVFKVK